MRAAAATTRAFGKPTWPQIPGIQDELLELITANEALQRLIEQGVLNHGQDVLVREKIESNGVLVDELRAKNAANTGGLCLPPEAPAVVKALLEKYGEHWVTITPMLLEQLSIDLTPNQWLSYARHGGLTTGLPTPTHRAAARRSRNETELVMIRTAFNAAVAKHGPIPKAGRKTAAGTAAAAATWSAISAEMCTHADPC
jgi:hypothetical protein